MIFHRALLREFAGLAGAVFMTLFAISLTTRLIRLLGQAAGGTIPTDAVIAFLGFFALGALPVLLSLTMFISVLLTLTRGWRDSEMVIWFGSGLPLTAWLRPVMMFALPQIAVIAVLSLFISPWAAQMGEQYQSRVQARDDVSRVSPGVFGETGNKERVFFVESVSGDSSSVQNVFVASVQQARMGVSMSRTGHTGVARRRASVGAGAGAAGDPDELRQPARRTLRQPAVRAVHVYRVLEPPQREPGASLAGPARFRCRLVAGARRHGAAAAVHVRAAHAADPSAGRPVSDERRTQPHARALPGAADLRRGRLRPARFSRAVRLFRPDQGARRSRQRRVPPAAGIQLRAAVGPGARVRVVPGGGADRHAVRPRAPREQLGVHRHARLRVFACARRAGADPYRPGLRPGDLRHRRMDRSVRRGGSAEAAPARHELADRRHAAVGAVVQGRGVVHQRARSAPRGRAAGCAHL